MMIWGGWDDIIRMSACGGWEGGGDWKNMMKRILFDATTLPTLLLPLTRLMLGQIVGDLAPQLEGVG
jgi:hypothetical protein